MHDNNTYMQMKAIQHMFSEIKLKKIPNPVRTTTSINNRIRIPKESHRTQRVLLPEPKNPFSQLDDMITRQKSLNHQLHQQTKSQLFASKSVLTLEEDQPNLRVKQLGKLKIKREFKFDKDVIQAVNRQMNEQIQDKLIQSKQGLTLFKRYLQERGQRSPWFMKALDMA